MSLFQRPLYQTLADVSVRVFSKSYTVGHTVTAEHQKDYRENIPLFPRNVHAADQSIHKRGLLVYVCDVIGGRSAVGDSVLGPASRLVQLRTACLCGHHL